MGRKSARAVTPQEKKRASLERNHVNDAEYPKSFRTTWPRKKKRAERAYRHAVRQALDALPLDEADEDVPALARKPVKKWPGTAVPLGEMIDRRQARRNERKRRKEVERAERERARALRRRP